MTQQTGVTGSVDLVVQEDKAEHEQEKELPEEQQNGVQSLFEGRVQVHKHQITHLHQHGQNRLEFSVQLVVNHILNSLIQASMS